MTIAVQKPWTVERFLDGAAAQDAPCEFDGMQPVAMTGGHANHSRITTNIHAAPRSRLRGPRARISVRTLACAPSATPSASLMPSSPAPNSPAPTALRPAFGSCSSINSYVMLETDFAGLLVLHPQNSRDDWSALPLTRADTLDLPDIGIAIPVALFYEDVEFAVGLAE